MRKILFFFLYSSAIFSQKNNVEGFYNTNENNYDTAIKLNSDYTYDFINSSGYYTVEGNEITLIPKFSFEIEKKQGNSSLLQLTFKKKEDDFDPTNPFYLYVGYENDKGEVEYLWVAKKYSSGQEITIEIPRTKNLYLVDAKRKYYSSAQQNRQVTIEKFVIGEETNAIDVFYIGGAIYTKAFYNEEDQYLIIKDNDINRYDRVIPNSYQKPVSSKKVSGWEHLVEVPGITVPFERETKTLEKKVDEEPPIQAESIQKAIQLTSERNKLLAVLYQPKVASASKLYKWFLIKNPEPKYPHGVLYYQFYLASADDYNKWLKKRGIPNDNVLVFLDSDGEKVFYDKFNIEKDEEDSRIMDEEYQKYFCSLSLARKLDKILGNPSSPLKEVVKVLYQATDGYELNAYLFARERPDVKEKEGSHLTKKNLETHRYSSNLYRNRIAMYDLKLTPKQFLFQWKRLIDSHKEDKILDTDYARLLSKAENGRLFAAIFYSGSIPNRADLDAVAYQVKFYQAIEDYNEQQKKAELYGKIPSSKSHMENTLHKIASSGIVPIKEISEVYAQGVQKGVFSESNYIDFLYKYDLSEAINIFEKYYNNLTSTETHIIVALDKAYTQNPSNNWHFFKKNFANRANNIAWSIYQAKISDKETIQKAILWVETALSLFPDDKYYQDTLEKLLEFKEKTNVN